jgi:hypothetical protein
MRVSRVDKSQVDNSNAAICKVYLKELSQLVVQRTCIRQS